MRFLPEGIFTLMAGAGFYGVSGLWWLGVTAAVVVAATAFYVEWAHGDTVPAFPPNKASVTTSESAALLADTGAKYSTGQGKFMPEPVHMPALEESYNRANARHRGEVESLNQRLAEAEAMTDYWRNEYQRATAARWAA